MADTKKLFSLKDLEPALLSVIREGYSRGDFMKDLVAGLTVGVVALPLAMAFAIGAGASPAQGLYTAIAAGLLIAILGGSRHQVSGPTGAFVVIIAEVIALHGMDGLIVASIMAGILLILMGASGLGNLIKYIPYPVTVGFTTGIGVIIFVGQIKDLLGLKMPALDPEFFGKIGQYAEYVGTFTPVAALLGIGTVALIFFMRKMAPRIPAAVTAVALVTLIAFLLKLPVDSVGSKYGAIPRGFPLPRFPSFSLATVREVFPSALTIALLAAIESLLSAVVADGMTGTRHKAGAELCAQGVGNIAAAMLGGIPATGAIARTATNIKSGARSPVAAIIHALVLLLFTLFLGPVAEAIPLAALAGVLTVVAWDMSELPRFLGMRRAPVADLAVMLVTFLLTVIVDLTAAVQVGVLLSVILFIKRVTDTTSVDRSTGFSAEKSDRLPDAALELMYKKIPAGCEVYEIDGPFFFGVADMLQDALAGLSRPPKVFILRMRAVPSVDATGINALASFLRRCIRQKTLLLLSEVREQPLEALRKVGLMAEVGEQNCISDFEEALLRANDAILAHALPHKTPGQEFLNPGPTGKTGGHS